MGPEYVPDYGLELDDSYTREIMHNNYGKVLIDPYNNILENSKYLSTPIDQRPSIPVLQCDTPPENSLSYFLSTEDVPDNRVTLRESVLHNSFGRNKLQCNCTAACSSNRCKCKRSNRILIQSVISRLPAIIGFLINGRYAALLLTNLLLLVSYFWN